MAVASPAIDEMLSRIVPRFKPALVILFGSRARGDARPHSDLDVMVVLDVPGDPSRASSSIRDAIERGVEVDVHVTTPAEILERGHVPGWIQFPALHEGRVAFEASR